MTLEEKVDEIISLIRMLDTKLRFVQDDLDEMKAQIETLAVNAEMEAAQKQAVADQKRYKVERL